MNDFVVSRNGILVPEREYYWNENSKLFKCHLPGVQIDFANNCDVTFEVTDACYITTSDRCHFILGTNCCIIAGKECKIEARSQCFVLVLSDCSFSVGKDCTIDVIGGGVFDVGKNTVIIRRDVNEVYHAKDHIYLQSFTRESGFFTKEELMIRDIIK